MKFKDAKGITLVALVITIIILLILAGISISSLTDNGLFGKAQEAARETEIAGIKEDIQLDIYSEQLIKKRGSISSGELVSILDDYGTVNYEEDGTTIKGITTKKGYEIPISEIYTGEITGDGLTITDTADTKPSQAMPEKATVIENDASEGIVIADKNGNEWVWVEVPKTIVFETAKNSTDYDNIKTDLINYVADYRIENVIDEYNEACGVVATATKTAEEVYTEMYNKMLSSVYTNGGFWISRYEIGDATSTKNNTTRTSSSGITGKAVSKANQIPYDNVTCSQAQTLASGMSTDNDQVSSLLFGIQWDLTCKFIEEKTDLELADINSDSTSWGNYMNSSLTLYRGKYNPQTNVSGRWTEYNEDTENHVTNGQTSSNTTYYQLLTTGASEQTNKMNIYDLAGNVIEWTLEHDTRNESFPCSYRGGAEHLNGYNGPAAFRQDFVHGHGSNGFRATLY